MEFDNDFNSKYDMQQQQRNEKEEAARFNAGKDRVPPEFNPTEIPAGQALEDEDESVDWQGDKESPSQK